MLTDALLAIGPAGLGLREVAGTGTGLLAPAGVLLAAAFLAVVTAHLEAARADAEEEAGPGFDPLAWTDRLGLGQLATCALVFAAIATLFAWAGFLALGMGMAAVGLLAAAASFLLAAAGCARRALRRRGQRSRPS